NCTLCPAGTFGTAYGADSDDACRGCGPGNFSGEGWTFCETCPLGTISTGNASSCDFCTAGRIAESPGLDVCSPCTAGRYGFNTSTCVDCGPGRYSQELGAEGSESCLACPAGRASAAYGADSPLRC
ncbi:unnamed protein product, partial [Symbiodinium necroappetens]